VACGVLNISNINPLSGDSGYAACCMLIISSVFISLGLYYIIWATSHLIRLPNKINKQITLALLGIKVKT